MEKLTITGQLTVQNNSNYALGALKRLQSVDPNAVLIHTIVVDVKSGEFGARYVNTDGVCLRTENYGKIASTETASYIVEVI